MNTKSEKNRRRVISLLTREEIEYMDRLANDALFSTGVKLSKIDVISALVTAAMELGITGDDLRSKKDLINRLVKHSDLFDRRGYPRLNKALCMGLREMDSLGDYELSNTKDISLGGFCTDLTFKNKPVCVNQTIEVALKDPKETEEPVKVIGRVAWMQENPAGKGFRVGVEITYVKEKDKKRFYKFVSDEAGAKEKVKVKHRKH